MNEEENNLTLENINLRNYKIIFQLWNVVFIVIGLYIIINAEINDYINQHETLTSSFTSGPYSNGTPIQSFDAKYWFNILFFSSSILSLAIYFAMILVLLTFLTNYFTNNDDNIKLDSKRIIIIMFIAIAWNFVFVFSDIVFLTVSISITLDILFGIILMDKLLQNSQNEIKKSFFPIKIFIYILSLLMILSFIIFNIIIPPADNYNQLVLKINIITAPIYILMGLILFILTNYKFKKQHKSLSI